MRYFAELPNDVEFILKSHHVDLKRLLYAVKADLDRDGAFAGTYLTFDSERLYLISGVTKADENGSLSFVLEVFADYPLAEIEEVRIERLAHTARLIAVISSQDHVLCRFSMGYVEVFDRFSDRLMKTKRNEKIDDSGLKDMGARCPKCGLVYPDRDRKVCPKCQNKFSVVKRLMSIYMEYKWYALLMTIGILISTVFSFITPLFGNKILYDDVLTRGGKYYGEILWIVVMMLIIRVIGTLLSMGYGRLSAHIAPRMYRNLRLKAFEAMERQSLDYFTNRQTGALITRINDDAWTVYVFFVDMVQLVIVNTVMIAGLLGILFAMQSLLATIITVVLAVTTFLIQRFIRSQRKFYNRTNNAAWKLRSITSDVFNGQRVVKAFAREKNEITRFSSGNEDLFQSEFAISKHANDCFPFIRFLTRSGFGCLFYIGAVIIVTGGNFTLGLLTAFVSYAGMLQGPIDFFLSFSNWWSSCLDASSRLFEIMDATPKITDSKTAKDIPVLKGNIRLDHVSFEYDPGRPILKDVSFEIQAGTMFGLVGKTGAGKSTIINLMTRLYDVKEGMITIDGVNIREIKNADIRRNIGVVSQETYLFIGTVADNIRYAKPDAGMDEVISAAKAAFAHEFIMKLPYGYETRVGSGGVSLSGGERQRISIARAMLQKPAILILDEATAAMDTQTERRIQYAIDRLKEGRTIIAIAHRLSTLRDADMLACIEDGKLAEIGTHDELIRKKGVYFELHKLQAEAFRFVEMGE